MNRFIYNIRLSLTAAIIAACLFMASCETQQKASSYSSNKRSKTPKFMNDIAMGGNNHNAVSLDDVVQEDEEGDEEIAETKPLVTNDYTNHNPNRKSNIKVTYEEAEPQGLQQPINNVITKKVGARACKVKATSIVKQSATKTKIAAPVQVPPAPATTVATTTVTTKPATSNTVAFNNVEEKYAYMLGVLPQTLCNASLYQFIDEWYGVRYRLGGSTKNGIDCSAFVQQLYEHVFGMNLLRTAIEQFATSDFVKKATTLHEGDLVFFKIHSRRITHVGVYLSNNYFIHASRSQGITISNLNDSYWRKYYAGAGKLKG